MIGAIALLAIAVNPGPANWHIYNNARFGFSVCYPPSLRPAPESDSGDGRVFTGPAGGEMRAYSELYGTEHPRIGKRELEAEADAIKEGWPVSYRAHGANWFVISGQGGGRVHYQKVILRDDQFQDLKFEYPASAAAAWNPIAAQTSRCFR